MFLMQVQIFLLDFSKCYLRPRDVLCGLCLPRDHCINNDIGSGSLPLEFLGSVILGGICYITVLTSFQFSSVAQSCPTLCDPMNHSTPGLPVHHQIPEFTRTHIHRVSDAIQPCHPSPPALNPSQHQGIFQRVSSSHQVAKILEFQLQHQSFQ